MALAILCRCCVCAGMHLSTVVTHDHTVEKECWRCVLCGGAHNEGSRAEGPFRHGLQDPSRGWPSPLCWPLSYQDTQSTCTTSKSAQRILCEVVHPAEIAVDHTGWYIVFPEPQYCSAVSMLFNCKLGGTTCAIKAVRNSFSFTSIKTLTASRESHCCRRKRCHYEFFNWKFVPAQPRFHPYFDEVTIINGADASHAALGMVDMASMAAMTVSLDRTCSRYEAAV